ncbi:MAG: endonuclease domain-containing protein [Planctomycetia bacterium]|nr:endonuclease domain-containing protein [Planctomycetia bacterium]
MRGRPNYPAEQTINRARQLRRNATFPERLLWGNLRAGRLAGLKFRRQHPIGPFVADFYCDESKLVIELDGNSHDGRAKADRSRASYLAGVGLRVLRIANDDVLRELDEVLAAILAACGIEAKAAVAGRRSPRPSP